MNINLKIDSAPLNLRLQNGQRRLAYAVVNAINTTAKRIQGGRVFSRAWRLRTGEAPRRQAHRPQRLRREALHPLRRQR